MSGYCKGCGNYHEEDDDRLCSRCQWKAHSISEAKGDNMTHDERENQKAAERLIPGALALTKEAMTPAQQQAARIEKDVAAMEIGRKVQSGELATHDPSKYVVIPKDVFLTPKSDGADVRDFEELTIVVPITVAWDWEDDDDGCGSASRTGNSMTGWRGRYKSVVGVSVTPEDLAQAVTEALDGYADNVDLD